MRKIRHRPGRALTAAILCIASPALGQEAPYYYPPYAPPSQSSVYNQNSVYLPTTPSVSGQDMVRGAGGVTCQSAVASGGAYVDVGLIGAQDVFNRDTAALYGRVVVPLGKRPDRPDCTKLYEMELARMQMELDLMRMGLPDFGGPPSPPSPVSAEEDEPLGTPTIIGPAGAGIDAKGAEEAASPAEPQSMPVSPAPRIKPEREGANRSYLSMLRP